MQSRFENDKITALSNLPNPAVFIDMPCALERVASAIANNEKITVIGDYDVDGVTSCTIMQLFFDAVNYPIEIIIPNRFSDGYGLSPKIAERITSGLVITVDNGINATLSADILCANGCDLIIIDHHTMGQILPNAVAIIHPLMSEPRLNVTDICAATVVWYFIAGLKGRLGVQFDMKELLPLVAIATIADVMPLVCINRTLVKAGLKQLAISKLPFAQALQSLTKGHFSSETIAFQVAPRLNSAGRMSSATIAFEFLSAKTLDDAVRKLGELGSLNEQRKEIEAKTYQIASSQISHEDAVAVVYGDDWHEGVLGIVASRIVQNFKKPAVVLSVQEVSAKGSARSIGNVSIFELLKSASHCLENYGGHKAAAGLSLKSEQLEAFKAQINQSASTLDADDFISKAVHMGELGLDEVDLEMCDTLDMFEPYGQANERPKFLASNITVEKLSVVGKEQNVLKLTLVGRNTKKIDGVYFRNSALPHGRSEPINIGDRVSFLYQVVRNSWNGSSKAELVISEFLS